MTDHENTIQYVLACHPDAMCTRSPSSDGWKVYLRHNGTWVTWVALSGSHDRAEDAWQEVADKIKAKH